MRVTMSFIGRQPLITHNVRLSDPTDLIVRKIKAITDKKTNQTDSDREEITKLEWLGGLYEENGEVVIPAANIIKCLREAGAITKNGKDIARGVSPYTLNVPLILDGSRKVSDLLGNPVYMDSRQVKVQRNTIRRTRPIFHKWSMAADFELLEDVLSFDTLLKIGELAGLSTGLGDARILGYGRFDFAMSEA